MSSVSLPSTPVATPHPLPSEAAHTAAHTCLNCDYPVPDRFCGQCGQDAHHTHRFTMADMPHDVLHSIWHIDKGILYTLRTMIRRPGPTIREYLAGKRVDHFRPLSLLFFITGLYALLFSALHINLMPPRDPAMPEAVYQMQTSSSVSFMKYLSWFYVAMVPAWALAARWCLRRGGYNYAECLIIASFITAINNFITLLLLPVTYAYSGTPQIQTFSLYAMVLVIGYASWAYGNLLAHTTLGWLSRLWRGFLTFMLGYGVVVVVMVGVMIAMNWTGLKQSVKQQVQAQKEQQRKAADAKPAARPQ